MDGFMVMPMSEAAKIGDLFCTLTGNIHVLRKEHFTVMKMAQWCATGPFNVEIDIESMEKLAKKVNRSIRNFVDQYVLKNGNSIYLLGEDVLSTLLRLRVIRLASWIRALPPRRSPRNT